MSGEQEASTFQFEPDDVHDAYAQFEAQLLQRTGGPSGGHYDDYDSDEDGDMEDDYMRFIEEDQRRLAAQGAQGGGVGVPQGYDAHQGYEEAYYDEAAAAAAEQALIAEALKAAPAKTAGSSLSAGAKAFQPKFAMPVYTGETNNLNTGVGVVPNATGTTATAGTATKTSQYTEPGKPADPFAVQGEDSW